MDYLNPEAVAQQLVPHERITKGDTTFDIHRRIHRGWIEKSIQYTWNGEPCHHVERVQALTKSAFQSALSNAGLEVSHVWGDYALSKWTPDSPRTMILAHKPTNPDGMLLTTALFLATALFGGGLFVLMGKRGIDNLGLILSFGGAFIIAMCFLHLVPEAFAGTSSAGLCVVAGSCCRGCWNF